MVYGYARVSTKKQARTGTSLKEQEKLLHEAGAERIVSDEYSGTTMERPNLEKLLKKLKLGDKLIVTKLDRFARTAVEGGSIVNDLRNKGVTVQILNMGIADDTPMGKLFVTILLGFAEFERDMIVERTQTGRERARQKDGYQEGRPEKYKPEQIKHAINLLSEYSYTQVSEMTGISKSTLIRKKKKLKEGSLR